MLDGQAWLFLSKNLIITYFINRADVLCWYWSVFEGEFDVNRAKEAEFLLELAHGLLEGAIDLDEYIEGINLLIDAQGQDEPEN